MSRDADLLAMRREFLVARARLQRAELARSVRGVAAACQPSALAATAVGAVAARPLHWLGILATLLTAHRPALRRVGAMAWFAWRAAAWLKRAPRGASNG